MFCLKFLFFSILFVGALSDYVGSNSTTEIVNNVDDDMCHYAFYGSWLRNKPSVSNQREFFYMVDGKRYPAWQIRRKCPEYYSEQYSEFDVVHYPDLDNNTLQATATRTPITTIRRPTTTTPKPTTTTPKPTTTTPKPTTTTPKPTTTTRRPTTTTRRPTTTTRRPTTTTRKPTTTTLKPTTTTLKPTTTTPKPTTTTPRPTTTTPKPTTTTPKPTTTTRKPTTTTPKPTTTTRRLTTTTPKPTTTTRKSSSSRTSIKCASTKPPCKAKSGCPEGDSFYFNFLPFVFPKQSKQTA